MKIDIEEIKELLESAEEFKPLVKLTIKVLNDFAVEFKETGIALNKWIVESRIRAIKHYEEAGFTKEEAMLLTIDDWAKYEKLMLKAKWENK